MEGKESMLNPIESSPMKEAYILLRANSPQELSSRFTEEDQKLMTTSSWDYNNPELVINKVKTILDNISTENLSEKEVEWRNEILWFWNHHAISCAIGKYQDIEKAKYFAIEALEHQSHTEDHPNEITKLFDLLLNDKLDEAKVFSRQIKSSVEKDTAQFLIQSYQNNWKDF
jgi:hypothetical protein